MQKNLRKKAQAGILWKQACKDLREEELRQRAMARAMAYMMREDGKSFSEIAVALGVNVQKAYWLYAKAVHLQYVICQKQSCQAKEVEGVATTLFMNALNELRRNEINDYAKR